MGKVMILYFSEEEEDVFQRMLQMIGESPHFEICNKVQVKERLSIGGMELNLVEKNVVIHGTEIMLTKREFEILYLLAQSPGRIYSKEQIYNIIWQQPYYGDCNIVMNYIHYIRNKIENNPNKPLYIQTVWGSGYRFNKNLRGSL